MSEQPQNMHKVHELKTWPAFFEQILHGRKTFEVRINDRGFNVGDHLYLREYDAKLDKYSGRWMLYPAAYVMCGNGEMGIESGYCVMALGKRIDSNCDPTRMYSLANQQAQAQAFGLAPGREP